MTIDAEYRLVCESGAKRTETQLPGMHSQTSDIDQCAEKEIRKQTKSFDSIVKLFGDQLKDEAAPGQLQYVDGDGKWHDLVKKKQSYVDMIAVIKSAYLLHLRDGTRLQTTPKDAESDVSGWGDAKSTVVQDSKQDDGGWGASSQEEKPSSGGGGGGWGAPANEFSNLRIIDEPRKDNVNAGYKYNEQKQDDGNGYGYDKQNSAIYSNDTKRDSYDQQGDGYKQHDNQYNGHINYETKVNGLSATNDIKRDAQYITNAEGQQERVRESDAVQVEASHMALRSDEYSDARDDELAAKVFKSADGAGPSVGINFSKYEQVNVKITGTGAPNPFASFDELNLHRHMIANVKQCKYTTPTPVQKFGIPAVLAGRDLMACAQTGSGKTASFLVPIIDMAMKQGLNMNGGKRVNRDESLKPFCLIVAPTRELAIQIFNESRKFAFGTGIRPCVVYGGQQGTLQYQDMLNGCDLLVGTPGRLQDFVERGIISFRKLQFLVIDEADRMLDMGFEVQLRKLIDNNDFSDMTKRQTLMWSATFPSAIQKLAASFLKPDYLFLAVGRVGCACENVTQDVVLIDDYKKRTKLLDLLMESGRSRCLIFVGSKASADRLDNFLFDKGLPSTTIHGDRTQQQRESALESFRRGITPIIVATDVASRGLDIPDVHHVVVFDMPRNIDDYVHRIGRTGRAGHTGKATAFFTSNDASLAEDLVAILKEAEQVVPEFLQQMAAGGGVGYGGGGYGGGESYGGGGGQRDMRRGRW